ncbi:MAG: gamma-glutamylcyclotransferase [Myxococcota bacterium]
MPDTITVFAYGSLMFSPELPDALLRRERARLPGHRRDFNKRSIPRGCPAREARWPGLEVPDGFVADGAHHSLALGTMPEPGAALDGMILTYPRDVEDLLLEHLNRREGVRDDRPPEENSYVRVVAPARTRAGREVEAVTYLSNDRGRFHTPGLTLEEQARVLLHATPREDRGRALGVHYLLGSHRALREGGVTDAYLDDLVATVARLEGPWQEALAHDLGLR